jgi:aarF domain-containing kinase
VALHAGAPASARPALPLRSERRLTPPLAPPFPAPAPQTDPNWGNFFYDARTRKIGLLDFGATREYSKAFVDDYLRLVWAAAQRDRATIEEVSLRVGFLTGHESRAMLNAHIESGLVVGEPFVSHAPFDFKASGITSRVAGHGSTFADERLTAPPPEVYSLHRKLAGAFLICIRMGAVISCRDMLEEFHATHQWGEESPDARRGIVVRD